MSNFTPVSELAEYDDGRISWGLTLPEYAPVDQIGVNIKRLGRLARLGGFNSLKINGYRGDITSVSPEINDVDESGQATAGMRASVTKAPLQKSGVEKPDLYEEEFYEYFWPNGTISVNVAAVDERVAEKRGLRSGSVWADEINSAVKLGIRDSTSRHLLENPPSYIKAKLATEPLLDTFVFYYIYNKFMGVGPDVSFTDYLLFFGATSGTISSTIYAAMYAAMPSIRDRPSVNERRFSLFCGVHFDRAIAVNGLSRALPLARALK